MTPGPTAFTKSFDDFDLRRGQADSALRRNAGRLSVQTDINGRGCTAHSCKKAQCNGTDAETKKDDQPKRAPYGHYWIA